ncbi:hypothetical protein PACTADRAFT_50559 [Pachysolen tannophilus NRRL Y-2460]|uniref:protein-tyrosine-phosphatase n=1 Tax=Pachysolen tannophilus NRRL Y-2460 TaxID=669874 RepID=A0A1E4TSP9_PACTA|nr:hypothetical protein PACTADRAFT_50559 [Pachysolen tannophilus NRRL Y-2460]
MERILGGLYISSIQPLLDKVDFKKNYNITHILSVLPGPIPNEDEYLKNYVHKQIEVEDDDLTNIIQFFPECNKFIDSVLFPQGFNAKEKKPQKHAGAVLIHCAQGCSRSVTIVCAYLMRTYGLDVEKALFAVKRKKADISPNDNFLEQLKLYEFLLNKDDFLNDKIYRQWLLMHNVKLDPTGSQLIQEKDFFKNDTGIQENGMGKFIELRCKRCRQRLASSNTFVPHDPPSSSSEDKQSLFIRKAPHSNRIISMEQGANFCSHYYVEPLRWMQEELLKGELEGKFKCLKCDAKVGGYCWQGSRCSCGRWMIPAIYLQSNKVDACEVKKDIIHSVRVNSNNDSIS